MVSVRLFNTVFYKELYFHYCIANLIPPLLQLSCQSPPPTLVSLLTGLSLTAISVTHVLKEGNPQWHAEEEEVGSVVNSWKLTWHKSPRIRIHQCDV